MKINSFILLYIFLHPLTSICQTLSDIPPFEITKPKWQYYTYDYYFPQNPRTPEDTPYGNRNFVKSIEKGEFLYHLESTFTALNGYSGWDGFRLTKLNKYSGEEVWVHQHNQHTGVKNFERPRPYIGFNTDGSIEIITLRHRDTTIRNNSNNFPFIGTPAIHTIDAETGQNITFKYGTDTTLFDHARFNDGGARLHRQEEGRYFSLLYRSENNNGISKDFFEFNEVDNDLNIVKTPSTLLELNPDLSDAYRPWTNTLFNKDTMIILTGTRDRGDSFNSPKKAFLHWYNISNTDSVYASKTMEVTDVFARPQKNVYRYDPELYFKQGHIFLKQTMQPDSKLPFKNFVWLLWTDSKGNVLGKFDYITREDTFYLDIRPIGIKNGKAYFLANYNATIDDPIEKWDVLEIEPYTMVIKKVGQFESHQHMNLTFRYTVRNADFLDNGSISVQSDIKLKKNNLEYWYFHLCSVDEKDLGISTSTNNTNIIPVWSHVYPNPTSDRLYIHTENGTVPEISIRDITGKLIFVLKNQNDKENDIDVSGLAPGLYYVTVADTTGLKPVMTHKVVRL
ncbi:MAG: T9SS type A sorting domain-containing protein [Saprospiraceae bacterium]|nr:T9SS type A sorting domain-containing protein [Saprospiraceae bacterium]